jgi:iron complex outermembrane recepter protein
MMNIRNHPWSSARARLALICVSATWAVTGWCQSTNGANDATPSENGAPELQEVVVTALRRDTELQKTPVSVAAVSGAQLSEKGALDFIDFAASVPGFTILDDGPGQRRPIIRGIEGFGEGEVGIYYDEFPITSTPGATNDAGRFTPDIKLVDVQQVEVLRGPQGTLFGAGSEGGTIQTLFNKPDPGGFSAYVNTDVGKVSHGSQNGVISAVANVPLINDVLAFRVVAYEDSQSGYIDNITLGAHDINRGYADGARVAIRYQPADELTVDVLTLYHHAHYDGGSEAIANLGDLQSNVPAYDPFDDTVYMTGLTAQYRFGFATLIADASYFKRELDFDFTFPGLPIPWADAPAQGLAPFAPGDPTVGNSNVQQPQNTRAPSYELRLVAPNAEAPLQWTFGGFAQDRTAYSGSNLPFVGANGEPDPAYPLFQARSILSTLKQRAVYGEASYKFFERLTLTAGGRWATFTAANSTAYTINLGGSPGTGSYAGSLREASSSKFIKRFNLAYELTGTVMAYVTYSEGFRAGGVNQAVQNEPTVPFGYSPDTIDNYEGGLKTQWFDKRVGVNVDYYHMNWNNIQVQESTPDGLIRFTTDAGRAEVDGVELEATARATPSLNLGLTYGWTYARLTADEPVNPGLTESGYSGNRLPNVPSQSLNFSVDYTHSLASDLALRAYTAYQYVGRSQNLFSPNLANPVTGAVTTTPDSGFAYMPGYSIINARIGLQTDRWTASLYVDNLADKRGITNVLWDPPFTPGRYTYYVMPRVIGVSVSAKL